MTKVLYVRHQFRDLGSYYVTRFFQEIYNILNIKYSNKYEFIIKNEPKYEQNGYGSIYSCMNFSIINPINNRYILISFFDNWKYHFMQHLGWQPSKMVQFFYPGGFNYLDYFNFKHNEKNNKDINCPLNIESLYKPFFYSTYEDGSLDFISDLFSKRDLKNTIPQLYFKGYLWDFRKKITENINDSSIKVINKHENNNNLNYLEYLKELSQYRCALSLPGGTEVCNRDIECFAIGVPVIRPYLNIEYPDPLISNYHYVSCYINCQYWDGNPTYLSNKDFSDYTENYWNKIKNNFEYLNFISNNARSWFFKNCTLNNNVNYVLSQIDLEKLYG
jgi:hypothetical protein